VALQLAGEVEHRMLILESTFTCMCDVVDNLFCGAPIGCFCHEKFPNLDRIRNYQKPVFFSHGDWDRLIPYSQSQKLFDAAPGPKELWKCDRMGHNDRRNQQAYAALVRDFLEKHW
jgi:fermentation-respiration switch protein FrsA (DUF1100 family)